MVGSQNSLGLQSTESAQSAPGVVHALERQICPDAQQAPLQCAAPAQPGVQAPSTQSSPGAQHTAGVPQYSADWHPPASPPVPPPPLLVPPPPPVLPPLPVVPVEVGPVPPPPHARGSEAVRARATRRRRCIGRLHQISLGDARRRSASREPRGFFNPPFPEVGPCRGESYRICTPCAANDADTRTASEHEGVAGWFVAAHQSPLKMISLAASRSHTMTPWGFFVP